MDRTAPNRRRRSINTPVRLAGQEVSQCLMRARVVQLVAEIVHSADLPWTAMRRRRVY